MIEFEDVEQPENIEKNNMKVKQKQEMWILKILKTLTQSKEGPTKGRGDYHPKIKFGGKNYDTQFTTSTRAKKKILCMTCKNQMWM